MRLDHQDPGTTRVPVLQYNWMNRYRWTIQWDEPEGNVVFRHHEPGEMVGFYVVVICPATTDFVSRESLESVTSSTQRDDVMYSSMANSQPAPI